ncbi:MAG: hypothetical protein R3F59_29010 [Myxococcota bacterium]
MSNPYEDLSAGAAPSATSASSPAAGPPSVADLVSKTASTVMEDFVPFLVAGLPFLGVVFVAVFAALFGIYGTMFAGILVGQAVGGDELAGIGAIVGALGSTFVVLTAILAVAAPMQASVMRAVWNQLETGEKLTISAGFSTITQDLGKVIGFNLLLFFGVMVGSLFCYLPGLAVAAALVFALPAIVVHRQSVGSAISLSVAHLQAHPGWHLGFFGLSMVLAMVLSYIPFIGYALVATIHPLFTLLAYREIFGTGEYPEVRD